VDDPGNTRRAVHIAGSLIHLLLVVAVIVLVIQLVTGRRV
jgi:hypothetical protein